MAKSKDRHALQSPADSPFSEVLILADAVGKSATTLIEVLHDFLGIVEDPIIAGGFAMANYGVVRATVDIDVIATVSVRKAIGQLEDRGYKHEFVQLPIGGLDLLTKGNKGIDFIHLNDDDFLNSIQKRAPRADLLAYPVRFVSLEDLIVLKTLAIRGRTKNQDTVDLESLVAMKYDSDYVRDWVKKLSC